MPFKFSTLSGWNRRLTSTFIDIVQQLVTVIPTVCQYIASLYVNMLQHRDGVIDIIALSFAEHDIQRISIGIYGRMDFCAGTSPAVSNLIGRPPFFAPALCWCACTMEASRDNSWGAASRLKSRKILSRIPSSIHFRKRL